MVKRLVLIEIYHSQVLRKAFPVGKPQSETCMFTHTLDPFRFIFFFLLPCHSQDIIMFDSIRKRLCLPLMTLLAHRFENVNIPWMWSHEITPTRH